MLNEPGGAVPDDSSTRGRGGDPTAPQVRRGRAGRGVPTWLAGRFAALLVLVLGAAIAFAAVRVVGADDPLSVVDEHAHLDYALRVHDGVIPLRGMEYDPRVVDEWACGVGHEAGAPWSCGDTAVSAATLPSGRWTSGYIHYPTFFVGADAWRRALEATGAEVSPLAAYRSFSVLCLVLGVAACAGAARSAGLRGTGLVAGALAPSAAGSVLLLGVIVNPASAAVLAGALVAWAAVRWVRRGRGYVAVLVASACAAGTAATASLPVVAVGAAAALVWWRRRTDREVEGPWAPRLWQVGVLALVVVTPVLVWNRVIEARAVVPDGELYGAYPLPPLADLWAGALGELTPHSPWIDAQAERLAGTSVVGALARGAAYAATGWLGPVLLGTAVLLLVGAVLSARAVATRPTAAGRAVQGPAVAGPDAEGPAVQGPAPGATAGPSRWSRPALALLAGTLLVLVVYPPLLRLSNALSMGFDHAIVARYSLALTPLLVVAVLACARDRRVDAVVAGLAGVVVGGLALGTL